MTQLQLSARLRSAFLLGALYLFVSAPAFSQPVTFSIDSQGPLPGAVGGWGISLALSSGDILSPFPPGPAGPNPPAAVPTPVPPGVVLPGAIGGAGSYPGSLGLSPAAPVLEVDALSYGTDNGGRILFSVDDFSVGTVPSIRPPDVASEAASGDAGADIFAFLGPLTTTPPPVAFGNTQFIDGDGFPLSVGSLGLVEPNPATPGALPDPGSNVDAFDHDTAGGAISPGPVYFSLDAAFADPLEAAGVNTGTAAFHGVSGADVLVAFGGVFAVSIPAVVLGLDLGGAGTDDLDALAFNDADGSGGWTPGVDTILFSVRRGSAVIGVIDSGPLALSIEEGDILTIPTCGGCPPAILVAADAMGLATARAGFVPADDVDALDAYLNPTFSIDFQGPIVSGGALDGFGGGAPILDGDILTPPAPGPPGPNPAVPGPFAFPPGVEISALPGGAAVILGGLGITPGSGCCFELDALSYGSDEPGQLVFSVDEFATGVGIPGVPSFSGVAVEAAAAEVPADVFEYRGPIAPVPFGTILGNTQLMDGNGLPAFSVGGLALVEPSPFTPGILPDPGDNLDALDIDTSLADLTGAIYFSLDAAFADPFEVPPANAGTAAATGLAAVGVAFSGADLLTVIAGAFPAVATAGPALGLDIVGGFGSDDLDALVFNDLDGSGGYTAGDLFYFSIRRGSAVTGAVDSGPMALPIEEGDILKPPAILGMVPEIVIPAEALGLATIRSGTSPHPLGDDVDALDTVPVPEPGILLGLLSGAGLLGALARRRIRG